MYAHGGIVAAAASILADMEQHHLLRRLLEEYDPFDQRHQQPNRSDFLPRSALLHFSCACLSLAAVSFVFSWLFLSSSCVFSLCIMPLDRLISASCCPGCCLVPVVTDMYHTPGLMLMPHATLQWLHLEP